MNQLPDGTWNCGIEQHEHMTEMTAINCRIAQIEKSFADTPSTPRGQSINSECCHLAEMMVDIFRLDPRHTTTLIGGLAFFAAAIRREAKGKSNA